MGDPNRPGSKLFELALAWLAEDKEARIAAEIAIEGKVRRGAKEADPKDGESFYAKWVARKSSSNV